MFPYGSGVVEGKKWKGVREIIDHLMSENQSTASVREHNRLDLEADHRSKRNVEARVAKRFR